MLAAWYERHGAAAEVLEVGEMAAPEPGTGEARVRVTLSGVNPGDTKKRLGWLGSSMPFPRVIPHSDAAGIIDAVGEGVDAARVGQRVWVYGAQSYRAFGTAAHFTVVPAELAVELPDEVGDETGACLGIPGITAHRCLFADGPVDAKTVLVQGVLGGVGALAAQLAAWGGATVIGTVTRTSDLERVDSAVEHAVALDQPQPAEAIRAHAPQGVDRIIEVAFSRTRISTRPSRPTMALSLPMPPAATAPSSRSGQCCSPTSRSGCSVATTFRSRPSAKPRPSSPPQRAREHCGYPSAIRCPLIESQRPTIGSTPGRVSGSSWRYPADQLVRRPSGLSAAPGN